MMAALKDAPADRFRTPPGLRMYRVNPDTGLPAGAGEPAIWEGYKPGTEPGKRPRCAACTAAPGDGCGAAPGPGAGAGGGSPAPASTRPAGGTGGLY